MFDPTLTKVVLIRKNKPEWMAGLLNAVGGHVEEGETFEQAAQREYHEETGHLTPLEAWVPFMRLFRPGNSPETLRTLECYWCVCDIMHQAKSMTEELVGVFDVQSLVSHEDIVKDTLWILLMAREAASRRLALGPEHDLYFEVHDKNPESQWLKLV